MSASKGAASAAPEFPRTLAAIEEDAGASKWKIADAILLELGPAVHGVNNDGAAEKMARFLAERGHPEWSVDQIVSMRFTAHAFRTGARLQSCSFETHRQARSIEMLEEAVRRNGGKPPTREFVRQMRRDIREAEEAAERKVQEAKRRRAEEAERKAREREQAARDEQARIRAQEQARKAQERRLLIEQQQATADRIREERRRKEADAKAARLAKELEDQDVADALARSRDVGARRAKDAVHRQEATRRAKVREENERLAAAGALSLPAFVPRMITEVSEWVGALRTITDEDLAGLPDDPFVAQLKKTIEDLAEQSLRWSTVLARGDDNVVDIIDGTARSANRRVLSR